MKTAIEGALWVAAALVLWLAPESWRPLAYVLIGASVLVAVWSLLDSRRRAREAQAAVDKAKRELDELRDKSE